jgi:hypothetical protein
MLFVEPDSELLLEFQHEPVFFFAGSKWVIRVGWKQTRSFGQPVLHDFGMYAGEQFQRGWIYF